MSASETRIWMFHRILPDELTAFGRTGCYRLRGTAVTPEELEQFLERASPIALAEVLSALANGEPPPSGDVLTFDDGYRECLMLLHGAPSSFYLTTGMHAGAARAHVVDTFYWLLDNARHQRFQLALPGGVVEGSLESDEAKRALVIGGPIKQRLLHDRAPYKILEQLSDALDAPIPDDLPARLYLRRSDWQRLATAGHELGTHGVEHVHMTHIETGALRRSLHRSASLLGATTLAYPDGAHDERVIQIARGAGLRGGLTCEAGAVHADSDPMRLPRCFATPAAVSA